MASWFTGLRGLSLPVELLKSDFIVSMPKLKTHHWAGMTGGMKNFFGVVPGSIYGWPKNILHVHGIDASILDLNATVKPHFAVLDAITAMEGDGPIMGHPRHMGFIAMSADLVAVDATCASIIGLNPDKLPYLPAAATSREHETVAHRTARREPRSLPDEIRHHRPAEAACAVKARNPAFSGELRINVGFLPDGLRRRSRSVSSGVR